MTKHAYIIVSNANFRVLEVCLRLIDDVRNDIFLLIDKKSHVSVEYYDKLKHLCKYSPLQIYEQIVNWGGYSQIDAVLHLITQCNQSGTEYQYIHFFQGSDLPIKSQDEIHSFFGENNGKEFVQVLKNQCVMAQNKTKYRHFFCHNRFFRTNKLMKILNFGTVKVQELLHLKKNLGMDVYQGSALFSITGECARYVEKRSKEIRKKFRFSLAGDEVFLQSILMDSPFADRIADVEKDISSNARLIDRSRPDGKNSPHIWRSDEFDSIMDAPKEICFARKFDEKIDFQIVKRVYNRIRDEEL